VSTIEQTEPAPDETMEEQLATLAKEYAEARDMAAEAAARKDAIRDRIIALVGDTVGKLAAGGFSISVSEQSRTTLDSKALRAWAAQDGFDLAPFEKVSSGKVLRVT
jgi:hypothetical protein